MFYLFQSHSSYLFQFDLENGFIIWIQNKEHGQNNRKMCGGLRKFVYQCQNYGRNMLPFINQWFPYSPIITKENLKESYEIFLFCYMPRMESDKY